MALFENDAERNLLLIDKPSGMTSFDVIRCLRRQTGIRKFGHAGTLDPLATGLLVLGCRSGTKRLSKLIKLDKTYQAEILLGQQRTTSDMEGVVVAQQEVSTLIPESVLKQHLDQLVGELHLPVSAFSAVKINGVPMYKRAHKAAKAGEVVTDVPKRIMRVYEAELLDTQLIELDQQQFQLVTVRFAVGSGTYIRSLTEAFGESLGYPACLYNLRRTRVGDFLLDDAVSLSSVNEDTIDEYLI